MAKASGRRIGGGGRTNQSPAPRCSPQAPDRDETSSPSPGTTCWLGRPFGGGVAPCAGAGVADGADLKPVLGAAGKAGDGAARGFADVALRARSAGRGGLVELTQGRKDAKTQGFRLVGTFTRWVSEFKPVFPSRSPCPLRLRLLASLR
jgi:hypothetical protein